MAKTRTDDPAENAAEILKDLLIVQLGVAGVQQKTIRQIVGCDMHRVSRIVRHLKAPPKKEQT